MGKNNNNNNKKKGKMSRNQYGGTQTAQHAMIERPYAGPVHLANNGFEALTTNLFAFVQASTSVGGTIDFNISTGSVSRGARTQATDWSTLAAAYDEYVIKAVSLEFIPNFQHAVPPAQVTTTAQGFLTVVRKDTDATASSYSNIVTNDTRKWFPLNCRWKRIYRCARTVELSPIAVGTDYSQFGDIVCFATGLTSSISFGTFMIEWVVTFSVRS